MNPRYRDVFRRHRLLFASPVVLAAAFALWVGLSATKMYESGATLWSDSAVSAQTSVFGALPPAGQDQQLLNELLTTRYFQTAIANSSPLGAYLAHHPDRGWGPSTLIAKLRHAPSESDRIASALGPKRVKSNAKGPHVLEVSYDAPTPALAMQTLEAIIVQFRKQRGALRQDAISAAQKQVANASATLARARTDFTRYLDSHPSSTRNDPQLQALAASEREAVTGLQTATDTMNSATLAVANGESGQTVLRVVDEPQLPTGPVTGRKKLAESLIAGLFIGALISILGILGVARTGRVDSAADLDEEPQAPAVVASTSPADGAAVSRLGDRLERAE